MADNPPVQRRLAAILAADVAGYSRLMGADEEGTLARLKALRAGLIDPAIARHHGRIVKTTGDGFLVEFASVVDAMRCAIAWQAAMDERGEPAESRIEWRIGVNLGDVIIDGDDIFGDGVNIAARLEALAEPGGVCISHAVLTQTRGKLDFPVADLGDQALKNIAQPVHVFSVGTTLTHPVASAPGSPLSRNAGEGAGGRRPEAGEGLSAALPLPDKPSIAVLPFANMSGDPEQEYFADGMVEEIITALSRIRWLFVIARNSTFTYKGQAVDVKQVGRELGVRYVLEGSVRKGGNRVRITAQLIDAETGTHLWADRFDGSLEDVFDLQDMVATSVAGVIEPALQAAEMRRSAARPTTDLTAYDLYLRAVAVFFPLTKERIFVALGLLEQAIAIDLHYGPALSWAAVCYHQLVLNGWAEAPETTHRKAGDLARQALDATQDDPGVLVNTGLVLAQFGEDIGAMIGLIDRALALNPSFARGWYVSGLLRIFAGQHDVAIEHLETALRLSPRDRVGHPLNAIGMAHFYARRFDDAASKLLLAVQDHPGFAAPYRTLAACYAHLGRLDEARAIVAKLRALTPEVVPRYLPFRRPEDRELYLSGLRLAIGEPG
jgi:TolB-like protein/class 3 adenylate cyclase